MNETDKMAQFIDAFKGDCDGEYDDGDFAFDGQELDIDKFNDLKETSIKSLLAPPADGMKFASSNFQKEILNALDDFQKNSISLLKGTRKNMIKNFKGRVKANIKNQIKLHNIFGAFAIAITATKESKLINGCLPHLALWQNIIKP